MRVRANKIRKNAAAWFTMLFCFCFVLFCFECFVCFSMTDLHTTSFLTPPFICLFSLCCLAIAHWS